jgi:hypothetical protein
VSTVEPIGEVGEYRVESIVRSGTGGAVYRAEQSSLHRTVALYVPAASVPSSAEATQFVDDARLLAGLDHPNLLPLYDVDLANDRPFATVRDVGGRRLEELLREGALDARRAVAIGEQVAAALESLEAADVVPANLTKSVIVVDDDGSEHAYVSPLEAIVDAPPDAAALDRTTERASHHSTTALAQLLTAMVSGPEWDGRSRERLPPSLREAIDRTLARADSPSPGELMTAAREAVGPARVPAKRSRRAFVLAAGVLVVLAALLGATALALRGGSGSGAADAPVARVAATIPLQATPGSLAITDDTVWVATNEGTVLRVDPNRDEVVGSPIRFMPPRADENVTIRAGEGAIWVLDGSGGNLTRIDPSEARITGRLHVGGILHGATVADGSVWISRSPPRAGARQRGELIRVDASRFRATGQPIPIGPAALDIEVADGVAWTMNAGNGTITRVDLETGATRTVKPSTQPLDAALHEGTLWVPDPVDGTVTLLRTSPLSEPDEVIRAQHPFSVAATADTVWFLSDPGSESGSVLLYRIDPATSALVGRPVELGHNLGWLAAGPDVVWARNGATRALLRLVPTTPPPGPSAEGGESEKDTLVSGPLAPGTWRAREFAVPFSFSLDERGWVSHAPTQEAVELSRFTQPRTSLGVYAPRQVFTATGGVRRLRAVGDLATVLTSNPHVRVIARERIQVGGARALRLTVRVRPYEAYPDLCAQPCVAFLPLPGGLTVAAESDVIQRFSIASVGGRPLVVLETDGEGSDFTDTERLLRTLRTGASGG